MDKIISAEGQRAQRLRRIGSLDADDLVDIVEAADEFMVAGLCGDPTRYQIDEPLARLRAAGLADS